MKKVFNKVDRPLLVLTLVCLAFGVMMVGSASSLKAYMSEQDSFYYFKRQLFFIIVGLFGAYIILKNPIKRWRGLIYVGVLGVFGALVYVLFSGKIMNGISGWLFIGGFGIQPSEFAKTISILFLSVTFDKLMRVKFVSNVSKLLPFVVPIMYLFLIFLQPDLGTMIILFGVVAVLFFVVPYDNKTKVIISVFTIISALILIIAMLITGKGLTQAQKDRFTFKDPCTRYREQTGYQVCNGYIAINSGGLFGSGLGNSKQKYLYLPEAHTDFIFPIIIEETGLVTGILILFAYFIIIWRIIKIGKKSYNLQGTMICYGVATYIALHVIVNLVGVLGLLPLTGVPLPFYSYGGSFMINLIICLAFVQRCAIENKTFEQKHLVN